MQAKVSVAQQVAARASGTLERAAAVVLSQPVSVTLDAVPLKRAIDMIANLANVRVSYDVALVEAYPGVVSVRSERQALGVVFNRVLAGTSLRVVGVPGGRLAIVREDGVPAMAQGTIVGKVIDAKNRRAIRGAIVLLNGDTKGITVGEDGAFRLTAAPGEHMVTVRAMGMVRQTKRVTVVDGETVSVEIVLESSASVLDEVIVTGTVVATERKAIPTPITVITAEDIEKRGVNRIEELLRGEVPGVLALERGVGRYDGEPGAMMSSAVMARGRSSLDTAANPLKTYVDGVELTNPGYLGLIDPQTIDRIEIITGPQAATIYGSGAMGGVMQIFLKKGAGSSRTTTNVNLRYGVLENNFSTGRTPSHDHALSLTGSTGPAFSYAGNLAYRYSGQWQPLLFNRSVSGSIGVTGTYGPVAVNGSLGLSAGQNGTMRSLGWDGYIRSDQYGIMSLANIYQMVGITSGEFMFGPSRPRPSQRISRSSSQTMAINVDYRASSMWQHHVTMGRSQMVSGLQALGPNFDLPRDTFFLKSRANNGQMSVSYNTTYLHRLGFMASTFTAGIDTRWGENVSARGCTAKPGDRTLIGCADNGARLLETMVSNNRSMGGFGNWQLGFFDKFFFTTAVRGEQNPSYGRQHGLNLTPRFGATYTIDYAQLSVKFLASYGRATRPPLPEMREEIVRNSATYAPSQWIAQFESPNLGPEQSSGPQGGIEFYYGNRGSLTINRYVQQVTDLIQSVVVDTFWTTYIGYECCTWETQSQYLNTATIRQHGWEATGSLNIGAIRVQGTTSWNDSRVRSVASNLAFVGLGGISQPGSQALGQPTHASNVLVSYARGGTSITWNMNYVGTSLQRRGGTIIGWAIENQRLAMYRPRKDAFGLVSSPGYTKSNLTASQRLSPWISATINVRNLMNNYGTDAEQVSPSLGRQSLFGLSLRFPSR